VGNLTARHFNRVVQREFSKQAEEFARSGEMRRKGGLEILPALAEVKPYHHGVDVACGPGFVALVFAKHARKVVGVDLTGDMIGKARDPSHVECSLLGNGGLCSRLAASKSCVKKGSTSLEMWKIGRN
jgi:SAM-dependent methyltransferase